MIASIKKQLLIQWDAWVLGIAILCAGGVFGMILLSVIMRFDKEATSYFPVGTLIAALICGLYSILTVIGQTLVYFNMEVSMGSTRKQFFVSTFVVNVLENVSFVLMLVAICAAENALYAVWYAGMENEINLLPYLIRYGIGAALALLMISGFCGALILRYGAKAGWTFWVVWMVGCIGLPRVIEAADEAPNSFFGIIGNNLAGLMQRVPWNIWLCLVVIISLGCFAASYLLIRKQAVTT